MFFSNFGCVTISQKNWFFGRNFDTVQNFKRFLLEDVVIVVGIYGVKNHFKIPVEKWFS